MNFERPHSSRRSIPPRYSLRWRQPISSLVSVYFGIQALDLEWEKESEFHRIILKNLSMEYGTSTAEIMRCVDDAGYTNGIVVAYWTDAAEYSNWLKSSGFSRWFESANLLKGSVGYWCEAVTVPYDRHETIYSTYDYRVGFGRTPESFVVPVATNGHLGATKDRLSLPTINTVINRCGRVLPRSDANETLGRRLIALVPYDAIFLRSGRYWKDGPPEQLQNCTENSEPKLHAGMQYLAGTAEETGCMSLRVMENLNADGTPRSETSVVATLLSIEQLEEWATTHELNLDTFQHTSSMDRSRTEQTEIVTWHELSVISHGVMFEYVNCHPNTGMLPFAQILESV